MLLFIRFFKSVKRLAKVIKYSLVLISINLVVIFDKHYIRLYQLN